MNKQIEHIQTLKNFHIKGDPLILINIWDAGSARAIQESGAKIIATSSYSIAVAHGYEDGEKLPLDLVLANLRRIIHSVNLPVTADIESGYGENVYEIKETIRKLIEIGVAGINIEDQIIGGRGLHSIEEQCQRIQAIRDISRNLALPIFINARTDIFLKATDHLGAHLEEAIQRSIAYAKFGADGFFVPGLKNPEFIKHLCELSPIPINIMMMPGIESITQLAKLGVARISYGPAPYHAIMELLKNSGMALDS